MKKWWIVVQLSLVCLLGLLFFSKSAWADEAKEPIVTLNVHEIIPIDEKIKDGTPLAGVTVSIYDLTKDYQKTKNNGVLDVKTFIKEWKDKALTEKEALGTPLATDQTNGNGFCEFRVPLLNAQNYGVYLITANNNLANHGIIMPTIILFPIISAKTGKLMNTVEIYPQYVDRMHPAASQSERISLIEKNPEPTTADDSFQTNKIKIILIFIGLLLLLIMGVNYYANKKKINRID